MNAKFLLLVSVLILAGCVSVPAEVALRLDEASKHYASVTKVMTKEALVASLGAPQKEEGLEAVWETRFDAKNYDSLAVEFDSSGRAVKMTKAHGRKAWNSLGSMERSYVYEK